MMDIIISLLHIYLHEIIFDRLLVKFNQRAVIFVVVFPKKPFGHFSLSDLLFKVLYDVFFCNTGLALYFRHQIFLPVDKSPSVKEQPRSFLSKKGNVPNCMRIYRVVFG